MQAYPITSPEFLNNLATGFRELLARCGDVVHENVSPFASTPSNLADPQYGLDSIPSLRIGDGLIDLAEVIELHEAVVGKLPCPIQPDQLRDKLLRHRVALDYAESFSPFRQGVCTARSGEERDGAMRIQHANGEPRHLPVAGSFHHLTNTTAGEIGDVGGDVMMTIVDHVGGAQF